MKTLGLIQAVAGLLAVASLTCCGARQALPPQSPSKIANTASGNAISNVVSAKFKPDPHLLLEGPVRVTWTESKEGHPEYLLVAEHGDSRVTVDTLGSWYNQIRPSPEVLHDRLAECVGYTNSYLFLQQDGGGNAWRAHGFHVFKLAGTHLHYIGYTANGQYDGVFFSDDFDQLESNRITPHVDAPRFTLMLRERAGSFVVDIDATWNEAMSNSEYRTCLTSLQTAAKAKRPGGDNLEYSRDALLCLALTRYCNRTNEFHNVLILAARVYGNILPLLNEVRQVVPGGRDTDWENPYRESHKDK